jgi:hypothetical protein
MTPEDWQRLWRDHDAGRPRYSRADLLARAESLKGEWRYLPWFHAAGAIALVNAGLLWSLWTRTGRLLTLAVSFAALGFAFIIHALIWRKLIRGVSPVAPVVEYSIQVIEAERARLRHAFPLGSIGAIPLFASALALTSTFRSVAMGIIIGATAITLVGVFGWFRYRSLGRQLAELRRLPSDDLSTGSGS